jgi:hypothetical protein
MANDQGMSVKHLIETLKEFDPDMPVHFAFGYGDYVGTICATGVGDAREGRVIYSEQHGTHKEIDNDDDVYDSEKQNIFDAIILEG